VSVYLQPRPESYRIRWNNAWQPPIRRSRSFKVTDYDTNRKPVCDFLLLIYNNLPPILHRFQVMVQFSLARGECLTLTLSLGVIPCQYRRKWYITKNLILWPTFLTQKTWYISNHLYVIRPDRQATDGRTTAYSER